jgi:hypothetical protein
MKTTSILLIASLAVASVTKAQTTDYKDVAPIFIAKCTACHHAGGIQFPLTSYTDIKNNKNSVKFDIQNGTMPPWPADTSYKRYSHERTLTTAEVNKIANWITAGLPAGDTTLAPPIPTYGNAQLAATPDLILQIPTFTSTATTADLYVNIAVPMTLTQDMYLRAYEVKPGNAAIVHHTVLYIDTTGTSVSDYTGTSVGVNSSYSLGDFAPGSAPIVFPGIAPAKLGIRIKAGSQIIFQNHYPAGSAGQKDSTQVRLYFYPVGETGIREMNANNAIQDWAFSIAPNSIDTVKASLALGEDVSLFSIFPHAHLRGKSLLNYASDGINTIPLCRINKWDFDWQGFYTFNNFIKIPSTYTLYATHVYDNTANNPLNPNPNVTCLPGLNTYDEMLVDWMIMCPYKTGDELIDIGALLAADPIFNFNATKINTITYTPIAVTKAYPNPFTNDVTISTTLLSAQYVRVSIYNALGQEVNRLTSGIETAGKHNYVWNGKDANGNTLTKGMYTYKIQAGTTNSTGKLLYEGN